jgi:HK97 family phage portal protein
MRHFIANSLHRLAGWIGKAAPPMGNPATNGMGGAIDAYRKHRAPSHGDLLAELKNTAWTCASINAAVCADNPPKLYVRTYDGQPEPKCRTKALSRSHPLVLSHKGMAQVEEVIDHPLTNLLQSVNPVHNAFDLWELTEIYLEVFGSAYWFLDMEGPFGLPSQIWILPTQNVRPVRNPGSDNIVDYYDYRVGSSVQQFTPDQIIHFRFPNPRDPYASGLSPLQACFEQVALVSQYTAMKRAVYENTGIPSVILSPQEVIPPEERDRVEESWNQKFRKGGMGRVLVTESQMKTQILSHSMGDLAALAEAKATKEDIANAFHVPIPYLTGETNLANMEAAEIFHMRLCIRPRLRRRDEKLNEQLVPLYDPTGRLFLASEDPTPTSQKHLLQQQEQDIRLGIRSINEVRADRGLPPVAWGETPIPG